MVLLVVETVKLIIITFIRDQHSSWASPSGIILMGGWHSGSQRNTTEKIQPDGTSIYSFYLNYELA